MRKKVRGSVQRALLRAGYQLQRWPSEGSLERELQRLIRARSIRTVVDIGAHVGYYGQRLRDIGFDGRIVSFEPSPEPFERLRQTLDDGWEAHCVAVGDAEGIATLHLYSAHEEFTSLHAPTDVGRADWGLGESTEIQVPVRTLDALAYELDIDARTALIKIDTQGHDAAVLRGAPRTIAGAQGLQLELPLVRLYEGAQSFEDLFRAAHGVGFAPLGFFPVHAHPRPLIPVEFDGLFARRS